MVLESTDIVQIKVKDEWIQKGLKYGQLSWTQTFNRMGKASPYKKIQNIVIGKIAESAFQEYLKTAKIEFDLKGSTKWYEIDIDDLEINDVQIDVKSNFIDKNSNYIRRKKIDPKQESKLEWYLKCHALVPADQVSSKNRGSAKADKAYVFVFVEGTVDAQSKKHVLHAFWDYQWIKRAEHKNAPHIGKLNISSKSKRDLEFTIYGTSEPKKSVIEKIKLQNGVATTENSYHQVFAIYSDSGLPDSDLIVKSNSSGLIEIIKPILSFDVDNSVKPLKLITNNWNNVDVQIDFCYIAGWINKEDFIVISKEYPRYTKIFEQYEDTLTSNFGCEVTKLEAISQIGKL